MPDVTRYELWQHVRSLDLWAVRIECETLTGVFGPVPADQRGEPLGELLYDDHPDDLEWIFRASDNFTVVRAGV